MDHLYGRHFLVSVCFALLICGAAAEEEEGSCARLDTMPRRRSSPSVLKQERREVPDDDGSPARDEGLTEYEVQRQSRIAENRKRMAALGLPQISSSLMTGPSRRSARKSDVKGKRKMDDEDMDYEPNSDEGRGAYDDDDDREDELGEYEDEDYSASGSTRKKAIALSLQANNELSSPGKVGAVTPKERARRTEVQGTLHKGKSRTSFNSRVKLNEDELILHFFQFDETGKGSISIHDLARVAVAQDFDWKEKELYDMIHCFDTDGDGKLGLDDFRKIAERCNILQCCPDEEQLI